MAETLGQAVLEVSISGVERVQAGMKAVEQQASTTGRAIETSFASSGRGITVTTTNIEALNRRLAALRAEQVNLKVNSAEYRTAEQQITQVQNRIKQISGTTVKVGADTRTLDGMRQRLAQIQAELGKVDVESKSFTRLAREARAAEKAIEQAERPVKSFGSGLANGLGGVVAGFVSLAAIGAGLKGTIDAAVELEGITRKLTNTLGDQGAQQAIGFLRGLSDDLGLSFNVLADSFGSFTAAASAANIPLSEQKDLFAAVATSGQRLGLSNDAINGSLLALQQVASKGVVQMQELREQLGERLPTAFAATARGLGISSAELIKLVESGKLTAEQFFPALTEGLNELNSGGNSVPTAAQNFASFGNTLEKLKVTIGQSLLPELTKGVETLNEALQGFLVQQEARGLGLANALGGVSTEAAAATGNVKRLREEFGLTEEQSKTIFNEAIKDIGATRDVFGQLNLTSEQYGKILDLLPAKAKAITKEGREAAALKEKEIQDGRVANAQSAEQLNTLGKINERLKALRKENEGLDFGSSKLAKNNAEIEKLVTLTEEGAKKTEAAAEKIKTANEEAAKKSKEVADNYQKAANSAQSAAKSFADVVAGSKFASESAQKAARQNLEERAVAALNSNAVNRQAVSNSFGLGLAPPGSLNIEGGGRSFQQTFSGQAGGADLRSLDLSKLSELVNAISPLSDAQDNLTSAQKGLTEATKAQTEELKKSNERESNLAITVPVGQTKSLYLP